MSRRRLRLTLSPSAVLRTRRGRIGCSWVLGAILALILHVLLDVGAGSHTVAKAQDVVWTQRALAPRVGHAMAFDRARGVAVLFGGIINSMGNPTAETWEWHGGGSGGNDEGKWIPRMVNGPSARSGHAMVYDSIRGVTVLFGGQTSNGVYNGETWEWNGTTWSLRATTGPVARGYHAMAFDAVRGVTILFGGIISNIAASNETWEWNGTVWTRRLVSGPTARGSHAMAFDAARGNIVLFGGQSIGGVRNSETWTWTGTGWVSRGTGGPAARTGHAMAFDSTTNLVVLYGGYIYAVGANDETWEWNGSFWTRRMVTGPPARDGHAMAYNSTRRVSVIFGGPPTQGDTWEWSGGVAGTWTLRTSGAPLARRNHAMAYDMVRRTTMLSGGHTDFSFPSFETWEWDGIDAGLWTRLATTGPSSRRSHAVVYDSQRNVTVLFGGATSANNNETWEWNGAGAGTWSQRLVSGPSARSGHAMAYDSARGVSVLFGGRTGGGIASYDAETWEWNGTAWTQHLVTGPSGRIGHQMAYDSARGVTVLFGGSNATVSNAETWEWNGAAWTQRLVSGPGARTGHAMAYDSARGITVLYGGFLSNGFFASDTWEWNGVAWTPQIIFGPSGRTGHAMAYDSDRDVMVVFGGYDGFFRPDTWELGAPCEVAVSAQPASRLLCPEGTATFSFGATCPSGCTFEWQWQPAGTGTAWVNLVHGENTDGNGEPIVDVIGVDTASLEVTPLAEYANVAPRSFRCFVTSICDIVISDAGTLTLCAADYNCDGAADSQDFFQFITEFFSGAGDFNHDGFTTSQDFFDFLAVFFAPC